jgi:hypothetical protein
MENNPKRNIYYTFCHIIFFYLQKVLLLRLGLFSIVYLIFFQEKISNNAILFIFFAVSVKCNLTRVISLDSEK